MKKRDDVLVGLVMAVAILVAILGSLWLARGGLSKGYALYAKFPWSSGLKQGQPVLLAGVSVGYVDGVELRQRRETRIGVLGRKARQCQNADEMHDAAQQQARDDGEQQADHGHPTVAIDGIGASRCVRVATPTGVS